jgi:arginyl-tRNA synthetase
MISEEIIAALTDILHKILEESGQERPEGFKIVVEHPTNLKYGDYSTNVAMQLAKILKKSPISIANEVKDQLLRHAKINKLFDKIEVVAPGFINFYLDWEKWASRTFNVPALPTPNGPKAVIEHTSINPNKSAHIGHLRNSCIGDTLARLLKRTGYQVEVHNYIDDLGNQLADTMVGILQTSTEHVFSRFGDFCWETYANINKAYKENPDLQNERSVVLHALEKGNSNLAWLGLLVAERIVREHQRK